VTVAGIDARISSPGFPRRTLFNDLRALTSYEKVFGTLLRRIEALPMSSGYEEPSGFGSHRTKTGRTAVRGEVSAKGFPTRGWSPLLETEIKRMYRSGQYETVGILTCEKKTLALHGEDTHIIRSQRKENPG
jgi:hypothetical protein